MQILHNSSQSPTLPWIDTTTIDAQTQQLLFCLPYAGGGSTAFRGWQSQFTAHNIAICPIQLPGRENRFAHPPYRSLTQLIPDLAQVLRSTLQQYPLPYNLFGYSMGSLIAFELIRYRALHHFSLPNALIVAAANPPHWQRDSPNLHLLPDPELIVELQKFNGTPSAVLQNVELMALLLPLLRSDFQLLETYCYQPSCPLTVPILALGGERDTTVTIAALQQWQQHTSQFTLQTFSGDHFFIHSHQSALIQSVLQFLQKSSLSNTYFSHRYDYPSSKRASADLCDHTV
jgi:medium-chain acyl-[acyl-carrier-protein] hydrolase